jgi:phenylacetate-coenzyme A ligase PaaK-like adenylate-forming protein
VIAAATLDGWAADRLGLREPLDRARFDAARLRLLNATIERVRQASPFYRAHGLPSRRLASFADLAGVVPTRPDDLVRGVPPFLAVSQSAVARVVTLSTSGTTGAPKRFSFSAADREATLAFFAAGMGLFTGRGDRVGIFFSGERPGGIGDGLAEVVRRLGAEPLFVPADTAEGAVAVLRAERPTVLAGPPVALLAAGRTARADGGRPVTVRAVLSSGEALRSSVRRGLRRVFEAEVHDHWGMTETGYGGAVDCAVHAGLHLREADLLVEVVDPATGRPLPDGDTGEIVVTTLCAEAMPLLRYATGDRGRLLAGRCACGSVLKRLDPAIGRIGDGLEIAGGGRISLARLDERLFALDFVTDVAATLDAGDPPTLAIEVGVPAVWRGRGALAVVRATLVADPQIGPAIEAGRLRLDVRSADGALVPRSGKRRIRRLPE